MCDDTNPEPALVMFVQRFIQATDKWNAAKAAIEREYPKGLAATQLPANE
jgi:hypothetical protein